MRQDPDHDLHPTVVTRVAEFRARFMGHRVMTAWPATVSWFRADEGACEVALGRPSGAGVKPTPKSESDS